MYRTYGLICLKNGYVPTGTIILKVTNQSTKTMKHIRPAHY